MSKWQWDEEVLKVLGYVPDVSAEQELNALPGFLPPPLLTTACVAPWVSPHSTPLSSLPKYWLIHFVYKS